MGFIAELFHVCPECPNDFKIYMLKRPCNCPFCGVYLPMPDEKPYIPHETPNLNARLTGIEEAGVRKRHGSPTFYEMLNEMAEIHDIKSHDYASDKNPYGNYHFAGRLAVLFAHCEQDAGFVGRLGEKLYRLANLESSEKVPQNESIEDTERDLCTIMVLWMSDRRDRRKAKNPTTPMLPGTITEV